MNPMAAVDRMVRFYETLRQIGWSHGQAMAALAACIVAAAGVVGWIAYTLEGLRS